MLTKHLGVRFVYEGESSEGEGADREQMARELSQEDFAGLPRDWVMKLRQAATRLDADVVLDLLDDIRGQDASLADGLTVLVRSYRFDVILALTEHLETENEESVE